jgi:hypothetical protein
MLLDLAVKTVMAVCMGLKRARKVGKKFCVLCSSHSEEDRDT